MSERRSFWWPYRPILNTGPLGICPNVHISTPPLVTLYNLRKKLNWKLNFFFLIFFLNVFFFGAFLFRSNYFLSSVSSVSKLFPFFKPYLYNIFITLIKTVASPCGCGRRKIPKYKNGCLRLCLLGKI